MVERFLRFEKQAERHCQELYGFYHDPAKMVNLEQACNLLDSDNPNDEFLRDHITESFGKFLPEFNMKDLCWCTPFIIPGSILPSIGRKKHHMLVPTHRYPLLP